VPGTWDDLIWGDVCYWLRDDAWGEQQLVSEQSQDENIARLMRIQQLKAGQAHGKEMTLLSISMATLL